MHIGLFPIEDWLSSNRHNRTDIPGKTQENPHSYQSLDVIVSLSGAMESWPLYNHVKCWSYYSSLPLFPSCLHHRLYNLIFVSCIRKTLAFMYLFLYLPFLPVGYSTKYLYNIHPICSRHFAVAPTEPHLETF